MRKKPQETGREHGKEIGKHKPIGTAKGRYGMGCDAGKVIKIHDQDNWTKQDHGLWTLTGMLKKPPFACDREEGRTFAMKKRSMIVWAVLLAAGCARSPEEAPKTMVYKDVLPTFAPTE